MKTWTRYLPFLLLAALPALQACGGGGSAWQGTVTDSAGVAVVHNPATTIWGPGDEWTVTEDLKIGSVGGDPHYQFGQLTSVAVAGDGTIYVNDLQAVEVKAYDSQGQFLRTIGSKGSGPGEFVQPLFVLVGPDGSVIVPDLGNQRVNRFGPDGEPRGSFPIQMQAGIPARWMVDDAGRLLAQLRGLNIPGMAALAEGDPIVVYDTTGAVVDTVALLPKGQTVEGITEENLSIKVFAPEPVWDLDSTGSVYYAMNDQYRILVNSPDGALQKIITRDVTQKPVEESDRTAILRAMREQYQQFGVPPQQLDQLMQAIGFADFYPAFGNLFVGPGGTLWVQRIRSARDMAGEAEEAAEFDPQNIGSPEWEVFDAEGRYLGVVTLPERFTPVGGKGDDLYGIWRDELDVQYVLRLKVNRTAP